MSGFTPEQEERDAVHLALFKRNSLILSAFTAGVLFVLTLFGPPEPFDRGCSPIDPQTARAAQNGEQIVTIGLSSVIDRQPSTSRGTSKEHPESAAKIDSRGMDFAPSVFVPESQYPTERKNAENNGEGEFHAILRAGLDSRTMTEAGGESISARGGAA